MAYNPLEPLQGLTSLYGPIGRLPGSPDYDVQGKFGVPLELTNPSWAKWFDMVHAQAPGGITEPRARRPRVSVSDKDLAIGRPDISHEEWLDQPSIRALRGL